MLSAGEQVDPVYSRSKTYGHGVAQSILDFSLTTTEAFCITPLSVCCSRRELYFAHTAV